MRQTVRPDGILLWIAHGDLAALPQRIRRMRGVTVLPCEDVRSYKKLVFALERHPDAYLVTADDDVYYPPYWLETLVDAVRTGGDRTIVCHRAHRIVRLSDRRLARYAEWQHDVDDDAARQPSTDLLPIGIGGILYPPGTLSTAVTDRASF